MSIGVSIDIPVDGEKVGTALLTVFCVKVTRKKELESKNTKENNKKCAKIS